MIQGGIGIISAVLFCLTYHYAQSGPVVRPSRMVREIYPEVEQEIPESNQQQACVVGDSTYAPLTSIPSSSPCLHCTCQWGSVQCLAEACTPILGCRAVSHPGKCCPTYECECLHQGESYANGARLPQEPGKECSVCYCRGGHVQCAEVGCYTRADCEPRFVPGECCPKYEHCPPKDPLSDKIIITSPPPVLNFESDFISTWSSNTTSSSLGSSSAEGSGDDDIALNDEPKRSSTPITFSIREIESKGNKRQENVQILKVDKSTQTSSLNPQITIQEVIPPRTEFVPQKAVSISPQNPATYKLQESVLSTASSLQILTSSNELSDSESYASEKTEVYDHPPPVLRIGDQLLFIKQGQLVPEKDASTPSPVITLIGAEGLQIGLESGETIDHEILPQVSTSNTNINTQTSESDENVTVSDEITTETSSPTNPSTKNVDDEYIPEENPYYPAIPEDIMNLTQDEIISTESSLSVVPLKTKILPSVLELRNNDTKRVNASQEWLKNEPTKISIPLLNEKAAIPDDILLLVAASDTTTEKLDKIVAGPPDSSKETLELNEELFESVEFTTIPPIHGSLISSEDASVEFIQNDSSGVDTSDLVETVPGFEKTTQKITELEFKVESGPKNEVEMIETSGEKVIHEEIQKRDVVKKVLKDTFDNPKENIRTDDLDPQNESLEVSGLNEELNIVKPNLVALNSTKLTSNLPNITTTNRHKSKLTD